MYFIPLFCIILLFDKTYITRVFLLLLVLFKRYKTDIAYQPWYRIRDHNDLHNKFLLFVSEHLFKLKFILFYGVFPFILNDTYNHILIESLSIILYHYSFTLLSVSRNQSILLISVICGYKNCYTLGSFTVSFLQSLFIGLQLTRYSIIQTILLTFLEKSLMYAIWITRRGYLPIPPIS